MPTETKIKRISVFQIPAVQSVLNRWDFFVDEIPVQRSEVYARNVLVFILPYYICTILQLV